MGLLHECVAEALGIAFIIIFGTGSVAAASDLLYPGSNGGFFAGSPLTTSLFINCCWGLSVTFGVVVSFDVSGAHLNPAVTINAVVCGGFPICKALAYILAQFIGAAVGAVLILFDFVTMKGSKAEPYLFPAYFTARHPSVNVGNAFFNEVFATFLLVLTISAITNSKDKFNKFIVGGFVGLLVFVIGNVFGVLTGYALNPARDLSPRIVYQVFEAIYHPDADYWGPVWGYGYGLWVPTGGPIVGGVLGGLFYKYLIVLPKDKDGKEDGEGSKDDRSIGDRLEDAAGAVGNQSSSRSRG